MADFNLQFPSQEMINTYVRKHTFDKTYFVAPQIGIEEDDVSNLSSPAAIMWDVLEPTQGMTKASALDADPKVIKQRVRKTMAYKPLYFRECFELGESQLTNARRLGSSVERAGMDLVYDVVDQANERIDTRIEQTSLEMLTGTLQVDGAERVDYGFTNAQKPNVSSTSGYCGHYWDNASADPIADIRKATEVLLYKGAKGITLVADVSVMKYISQRNVDLLKQSQFAVQVGPETLRDLLPGIIGCGVTKVVMGNQGFVNEQGNGQSFIPAGKCFLVGQLRNGEKIGAWRSVPSIYNGVDDARGGRFVRIDNELERSGGCVPRITVTAGIYGLPVLYRPDLVVAMKVLNV